MIGNAVHVMRLATGEIEENPSKVSKRASAVRRALRFSRQNSGQKSLKLSPAMAAGITDKLWSVADLAEMIDATLPLPGKRGPYKKQPAEISN